MRNVSMDLSRNLVETSGDSVKPYVARPATVIFAQVLHGLSRKYCTVAW